MVLGVQQALIRKSKVQSTIMNNSNKLLEAYHQDLNYWLERQTECQRSLNLIKSKAGNNESIGKLKGKIETYGEIIAYLQKKVNN